MYQTPPVHLLNFPNLAGLPQKTLSALRATVERVFVQNANYFQVLAYFLKDLSQNGSKNFFSNFFDFCKKINFRVKIFEFRLSTPPSGTFELFKSRRIRPEHVFFARSDGRKIFAFGDLFFGVLA